MIVPVLSLGAHLVVKVRQKVSQAGGRVISDEITNESDAISIINSTLGLPMNTQKLLCCLPLHKRLLTKRTGIDSFVF